MTVTVTTSGPFATAPDTNLTIVQIAANVARETSIPAPDTLINNADETAKNMLHFITKASEEVARRVDWGTLEATTDIGGVGSNAIFELPNDFSRLTQGSSVLLSDGTPVRGGISNDEWATLPDTEGNPRFYHLAGKSIRFYPYPATGTTISINFQSKFFSSANSDIFTADDDTIKLPHELVEKCVIYRWRRHTGQSFADYEAEFEAALIDYGAFDVSDRTP